MKIRHIALGFSPRAIFRLQCLSHRTYAFTCYTTVVLTVTLSATISWIPEISM